MKPGSPEWFQWFYDGRIDQAGGIEERWHEDLVLIQAPEMMDTAGEFHGYDGLRAVNEELSESFANLTWDVREVHELGDERYLVLIMARGAARTSGVDLPPQEIAHIVTLRGDRAARLETHIGWDQGRDAAGLG